MAFSQRRGRPKKESIDEKDRGTPELSLKRRYAVTAEPLDWLRKHDWITPQQHWCGLHLRWLYTLRFGVVTPQTLDWAREKGVLRKKEYTEWQEQREEGWRRALEVLQYENAEREVVHLCVYLMQVPGIWVQHRPPVRLLGRLEKGLSALEVLWCKPATKH